MTSVASPGVREQQTQRDGRDDQRTGLGETARHEERLETETNGASETNGGGRHTRVRRAGDDRSSPPGLEPSTAPREGRCF